MEVAADLPAFAERAHEFVRAALRVRTREADPLKPVDLVQRREETGEGF